MQIFSIVTYKHILFIEQLRCYKKRVIRQDNNKKSWGGKKLNKKVLNNVNECQTPIHKETVAHAKLNFKMYNYIWFNFSILQAYTEPQTPVPSLFIKILSH